MSVVKRISDHSYALHMNDGRVFTLSNHKGGDLDSLLWQTQSRNWEYMPASVCGYQVIPYGHDNMLPSRLRDVVDDNNLAPGIIDRQMGLLYGQGVFLNQLSFDNGEITHRWQEDTEIQAWLDSWDYIPYIKGVMTDYLYLKGFFDAKYLTRGHRIGRTAKISHLEHIPAKNARLEWTDSRNISDVKHILVGDFEHACTNTGVRIYPVYNRRRPDQYAAAASYNHTYSFSRDFYSVPQYWGALRWIVRGSEIPTIFKYVTENGLNLAYHVHSPQGYWDQKRDVIRRSNPDWNEARIEQEISDLSTRFLDMLTEVLSGKENAGKFFHTLDVCDETGTVHSWKVEAIDQKIKDFVDSQLKIAEASSSAITSGMGLHPSLSNVMVNGKLASGSELLYAFRLHLLSSVEIASNAILESINQAIAFNFPKKNLRLGFYHQSLKAEEALNAGDRIKNQ
ncbi:hypothetical protein [Alistipes putredinis]|uniref:hypothetical protein n=1 Tax=Alistipes putredinis TaxID=28117 RepID=UPI003AB35A4F